MSGFHGLKKWSGPQLGCLWSGLWPPLLYVSSMFFFICLAWVPLVGSLAASASFVPHVFSICLPSWMPLVGSLAASAAFVSHVFLCLFPSLGASGWPLLHFFPTSVFMCFPSSCLAVLVSHHLVFGQHVFHDLVFHHLASHCVVSHHLVWAGTGAWLDGQP